MPVETRVPSPRSSFRWRLLLAFIGVSSFAVLGGAVAIYALSNIENVLVRITEQSVPSVLISLQLSRDAERLVSAAPVMLTSTSQNEHQKNASKIRDDIQHLNGVLDELRQYHFDAVLIDQIAAVVNWLTLNLISMETTIGNAIAIVEQRKALTRDALEVSSAIRIALDSAQRLQPPEPAVPRILQVKFELTSLVDLLSSIGLIDDRDRLQAMRRRLRDSASNMKSLIQNLDAGIQSETAESVTRFYTYIEGSRSIARVRLLELEARKNAWQLLSESTRASRELTEAIESLVAETTEEIHLAGSAARKERRTGTVLLIVAVSLSLLSSVLIVWLYVQRNLIRRLSSLSSSMLAIAKGDVKATIPTGGADEIASMADALTVFRVATTERVVAERARANLSRYFSPNLAEHLATNPRTFELGGERREMTFLFTDLASFTTLVEQLDPAVVVALMNEYIGGISGIVFEHGGTVDTVVGDAVHAIFGAPMEQPDHAARGVACALAIDKFAQRFEGSKAAESVAVGITRIGVHTGSAIVGNFGGKDYFHYTAHGDAVNTAARLETANKKLGTRMCVSANTVGSIPHFVGRPIGSLILQGKANEIFAFEPYDPDRGGEERLTQYLDAFDLLQAGDPGCLRAFAAYVGKYDNDPLASFHLQRLLGGQISTEISVTTAG